MSQLTYDFLETQTADLTAAERHALLESDRRRDTLSILANRTGPIPLETIASEVAARDSTVDETDTAALDATAMSLHHIHLPKLDEAGMIDYDPTTNKITR